MSTTRGKSAGSKETGAPAQRAPAGTSSVPPPRSLPPSTETIDDEWGDVPDTLTDPGAQPIAVHRVVSITPRPAGRVSSAPPATDGAESKPASATGPTESKPTPPADSRTEPTTALGSERPAESSPPPRNDRQAQPTVVISAGRDAGESPTSSREEAAAQSQISTGAPVATDAEPDVLAPPAPNGRRSLWLGAAAAIALLGIGAWFVLGNDSRQDTALQRPPAVRAAEPTTAAPAPEPEPEKQPAAAPAAADEIAPTAAAPIPTDATEKTDEAKQAANVDEAKPGDTAEVEPGAGTSDTPAENGATVKTVSVKTVPPGAELYERGLRVGRTPLTLNVETGKRRRFEVGLPGYQVRKLVLDGSDPEVTVGLRAVTEKKK